MNDGYSLCFNKWALDKDIKNELGLLLIISSLCAERGYCYANNQYLADIFGITEISISSKISKLQKKGYIEIEYEKRGCEVISRKIRLKNILTDDYKIFKSTIKKNFKDNNIIDNNIIKNNNINIIIKKSFKKPTIDEIKEYCLERKNDIDPDMFYNFYESKDWMIGKNKMKDWKACIRTWERNHKLKEQNVPTWFNDKELEKKGEDKYDELAKQLTKGTWQP